MNAPVKLIMSGYISKNIKSCITTNTIVEYKNGIMKLASDLFIDWMKKNWPETKQKATDMRKITWLKLGKSKKKGNKIVAKQLAKKLLNNSILNISSLPDKALIQMISNPIINAPNKQKAAIGSTVKSIEGLKRSKPPKKEKIPADHRIKPTSSLKKITAKAMANIGLRKLIAVASLIGINIIPINQIDIPTHPKSERKAWSFKCSDLNLGLK